MEFPTDFSNSAEALAANFDDKTNLAIDDLGRRGFVILHGLTPELTEQVAEMSKQKHIREYCPRDCSDERFASLESTRAWLARGHVFFVLAKKDDNQPVGYGWSGPKKTERVPSGETTFAVRIAAAGLGQKLSRPFSQAIVGATIKLYDAKNLWLETWDSNQGAHHVHEELGFKLVKRVESQRPTADGGTVADTRLFMSLPN